MSLNDPEPPFDPAQLRRQLPRYNSHPIHSSAAADTPSTIE
jgi:hypothetical protein